MSRSWMRGLLLLGFVDGGWVRTNNAGPLTSARPPSDQLASVGFGLRYSMGAVSLSMDWAQLISGSVTFGPTNPEAPQAGDHKVHVNLTARF